MGWGGRADWEEVSGKYGECAILHIESRAAIVDGVESELISCVNRDEAAPRGQTQPASERQAEDSALCLEADLRVVAGQ